jgi:hypothetical protein
LFACSAGHRDATVSQASTSALLRRAARFRGGTAMPVSVSGCGGSGFSDGSSGRARPAERRVLAPCLAFRPFAAGRRFRDLAVAMSLRPNANTATAITATAREISSGARTHMRAIQPKTKRRTAVVSSSSPAAKTSTASTATTAMPADRPKRAHRDATRRDRDRPPAPRVRGDRFAAWPRALRRGCLVMDALRAHDAVRTGIGVTADRVRADYLAAGPDANVSVPVGCRHGHHISHSVPGG